MCPDCAELLAELDEVAKAAAGFYDMHLSNAGAPDDLMLRCAVNGTLLNLQRIPETLMRALVSRTHEILTTKGEYRT